tara:strand:- start:4723 stop:5139 length:417 start_codon:yes stop_codon:yes gene_type:complete
MVIFDNHILNKIINYRYFHWTWKCPNNNKHVYDYDGNLSDDNDDKETHQCEFCYVHFCNCLVHETETTSICLCDLCDSIFCPDHCYVECIIDYSRDCKLGSFQGYNTYCFRCGKNKAQSILTEINNSSKLYKGKNKIK